MFTLICFLISAATPVGAKEIPTEVVTRLSYLIRAEAETQLKASGSAGSEEAAFETAERKLGLMEQTLTMANSNKADKFDKLIEFFKDKMVHKCCQLAGKSTERKFKGGGGGGRRRGGGGL